MDMLEKGMIHIRGRMEWGSDRFHPATENGTQFKPMNCLFLASCIGSLWAAADCG